MLVKSNIEVMRTKKILFIYNVNSSWITRDCNLLNKRFHVQSLLVKPKIYLTLRPFLLTAQSDVIFLWFGSLTFLPIALFSRILNKKLVIVAGGYDAANLKQYKHGTFSKTPLHKALGRTLFMLTNKVLAVSKSTKKDLVQNTKINPEKVSIIYHGFEKPDIVLTPWKLRSNTVVMISNIDSHRYFIKGLDRFLELAKSMPDVKFKLIGDVDKDSRDKIQILRLKNLEVLGSLKFNSPSFNKVLNESKVILQLSRYESFGAAVIDGALRGCFPVVSNVFALPELISPGYGVVTPLPYPSPAEMNAIFSSDIDVQDIVRVYLEKFSIQVREKSLVDAIDNIKMKDTF